MQTKAELRQHIRALRTQLSDEQRADRSRLIVQHAFASRYFQQHQTLGFYWPIHSEADIQALLEIALAHQKHCYLPKVCANSKKLNFLAYDHTTAMTGNTYGIQEPTSTSSIAPEQLDCVFVPLIAFDSQGFRLGQGGGYYDATFHQCTTHKPLLIGIGFSLQAVEQLPIDEWDLKLDAAITEKGIQTF